MAAGPQIESWTKEDVDLSLPPEPSLRGAMATKQTSYSGAFLDCFASLAMTKKSD
jgi:hypothetical protein